MIRISDRWRNGRKKEAIEAYEKAVAADGKNDHARWILEKLKAETK